MTIDKTLDSNATSLKYSHNSTSNNKWLENEICSAIKDPRPSIPHKQVMHEMDVLINKLMTNHK